MSHEVCIDSRRKDARAFTAENASKRAEMAEMYPKCDFFRLLGSPRRFPATIPGFAAEIWGRVFLRWQISIEISPNIFFFEGKFLQKFLEMYAEGK